MLIKTGKYLKTMMELSVFLIGEALDMGRTMKFCPAFYQALWPAVNEAEDAILEGKGRKGRNVRFAKDADPRELYNEAIFWTRKFVNFHDQATGEAQKAGAIGAAVFFRDLAIEIEGQAGRKLSVQPEQTARCERARTLEGEVRL